MGKIELREKSGRGLTKKEVLKGRCKQEQMEEHWKEDNGSGNAENGLLDVGVMENRVLKNENGGKRK